MASSIETAGVVLAAFPLLVKGLESWVSGIKTLRQWRRVRQDLTRWALRLESQNIFLLDTLEQLLVNSVHSSDELASMLALPGGPQWSSEGYEEELKARLDRSYPTFRARLSEIRAALQEMREMLGISDSGEVQPLLAQGHWHD